MDRLNRKKGMTLIEILLSIALLGIIAAMLMPGFTNQYAMLVRTRAMTEDLYAAQQTVEQTVVDARAAIQSGSAPAGLTRTPYVLFHGQAFARTVYGYPNQIEIHVGNSAINLAAVVADNRMPEFAVATATDVAIRLSDGTNTLPFAYFSSNLLRIASSYNLSDPENVNLTNISRWYVSREGFNIPSISGALEIEKGTIYPRFPDDYVLIRGESDYTLATILSTYAGRHIVYTLTPASTTGKMGDTVVSNAVFINGLPVISNLKLHLDASMISKEDNTAVDPTVTTVDGVSVTNYFVKKWNDLSGNGNNALQASAALQPQLVEADMGSFTSGTHEFETYAKYVQFDGSKGMSVADANSLDLNDTTVIVVARTTATTSGKTIVSKLSGTTGWFVGWNSNTQLGWYIKNSSGTNALSAAANVGLDGGWHILVGATAGSTMSLKTDESAATTGTRTIGSSITNSSPLTIGYNGGTNYSNVDVAEVIVYSGTLSADDQASVLTYLKNKYQPVPPVNGIYALKPIVDNAVIGESYTLPSYVQAYMTNGTMQNVSVRWAPTTANTASAGTRTYTATAIVDESKTTTLTLHVSGITNLENQTASVEKGLPFTMPSTVVANLDNGAQRDVAVTWNINSVDTGTEGTYVRTGTAVLDSSKTMTLTVTVVPRRVTGVTLDLHANTLNVGGTFLLAPTVAPASAANQNVTWRSSDTNVVTVDANGRVTAMGSGSATIVVTTVDGGFTDTCLVTVNVPVTGVSLNRTTVTLARSTSTQLTAALAPANASNRNVTWTSSNTSVAQVSTSGLVTVRSGASTGSTTVITVTTEDGARTATCTVTCGTPVTGISLSPSSRTISVGATTSFTSTINPTGATITGVTWSSSDTSVATVNASGVVTGVDGGTTTITVTTVDGGFTDTSTVTVTNPVTGVSLNRSAITLPRNGTVTLVATISPADASNQAVTWSSSNNSVATVNPSGLVTVVTSTYPRTAIITVSTDDGGYEATCTVTAGISLTGISVAPATLTLNKGSTSTLTVTYSPTNATTKTLAWTTSNASVATVGATGVVTAVGNGTATITATSVDGGFTDTTTVTVNVPVSSVSLNRTTLRLANGGTSTLVATVAPSDASNPAVTWSSSNNAVATVNASGLVTVVTMTYPSTAIITVRTVDGGYTATCTVTASVAATGVTVSPATLNLNKNAASSLTAAIVPSNATISTVTWSTNNSAVATVNAVGLVTAVGKGSATITATTTDGGFTDTCVVTVNVPVTGVTLDQSILYLARGVSYNLIDTIVPADASNTNVTWTSSNTSVATVDTNGRVTVTSGATYGQSTTITVRTADGGFTDTCVVTAVVKATGVSVTPATITIGRGNSSTLTANVNPAGATIRTVTWTTSNPAVATVGATGVVTAISKGTATITATTTDGGFMDTCDVTVNVPVTGVTLDKMNLYLARNGTYNLTATIIPSDADNQNVTWSSSNTGVAWVTNGVVTVRNNATYGATATITVTTADGGYTASCTVTAVIKVTGVSIPATRTVNVGSTYTPTVTFTPSNATIQTASWTSSNPAVATVNVTTGQIRGVSRGTATITVTSTDGGFTDTILITVP